MTSEASTPRYGLYWRIWLVLLSLTVLMIFLDSVAMPRGLLVMVLVLAMLIKAGLVAGYFMHLRFEKMALRVSVVVGLLLTAAVLFFLIMPDGYRILRLSAP